MEAREKHAILLTVSTNFNTGLHFDLCLYEFGSCWV